MNAANQRELKKRRAQVGRKIDNCLSKHTAEQLARVVSETVVGQGDAVRGVSLFLMTALRRIKLVASGVPSSELPNIGSLLLEGPSGCGKTLIVETICAELGGLKTYVIDGSTVTGAGWRGEDLEDHKLRIAKLQSEPGAGPVVVFVDEADKLPKMGSHPRSGFDPCEMFLRLIEGDNVEDITCSEKSGGGQPLFLDKTSLIFVFAGAFTGLDDIIRSRIIGKSAGQTAGFSANAEVMGTLSLDENELRLRSQPGDLIAWGMPRELVGRITSIVRVKPLSEDDLLSIIRGGEHSIESRFSKMMPAGCTFTIGIDAARSVASSEASSERGARGIEAVLTPISCTAVELAATNDSVVSISVAKGESGLQLEVERGERKVPDEEVPKSETGSHFFELLAARERSEGSSSAEVWTPPSWVDADDNLAHVALRLALGRTKDDADPLTTVSTHAEAEDMASAIVDVALDNLTASEARIAWELVYGCISYALRWGAPGDVNTKVLAMLLQEASKGKLLDRVLEVWDGESRTRRGEPSGLGCGVLRPGERHRRGHLEYFGTDARNDSALKHILFFYALSGRRAAKLSKKIAERVEALCGAKAGG